MPIPPKLPAWAVWAGFPEPGPDEGFCVYVERLGLDPEPLLEGLNERTYILANIRLASALMHADPVGFELYIVQRRQALVPSQ